MSCGRILGHIERARECLTGWSDVPRLQIRLPEDVGELEIRRGPGASRFEFGNRLVEAAGEEQRQAEHLHYLPAFAAAVGECVFKRTERGNRACVIIGVIRRDTEQVCDARVVRAAERVELADGFTRPASLDERPRGGDAVLDLAIAGLRLRRREAGKRQRERY